MELKELSYFLNTLNIVVLPQDQVSMQSTDFTRIGQILLLLFFFFEFSVK